MIRNSYSKVSWYEFGNLRVGKTCQSLQGSVKIKNAVFLRTCLCTTKHLVKFSQLFSSSLCDYKKNFRIQKGPIKSNYGLRNNFDQKYFPRKFVLAQIFSTAFPEKSITLIHVNVVNKIYLTKKVFLVNLVYSESEVQISS